MARPIHQLIAQARGPNIMGAQASAMQQMAAMQGMQGQKIEQDYAKKRMASMDQEAESARMKEGWGIVANMGLQISKLPPEQRAAAYQQARRQASLYMPAGLPPLPEEYNEQTQQALDFAVSQQYGGAEHQAELRRGPENLVEVVNPDGSKTLVPQSQAAGQQSALPPTNDERLVEVTNPDGSKKFVRESEAVGQMSQAAPAPKPEDLVEVVGEDGAKRYVPKSQAAGQVSSLPPKPSDSLTPAEEAVDKAFAKDYNEFVTQGGFSDIEKQLGQLGEAQQALEASANQGGMESAIPFMGEPNITGSGVGLLPDFIRAALPGGDEAISVREGVEEVVQRNLRLVLGAQFTQKEGDRLISRAFNPKLTEAENAKRVGRLMEQIQSAASQKMAAARYYEENGTLKGFKGKTSFSASDFNPEAEAKPSSDYADGTIAEGPNGERMVFRNGAWVPLSSAVSGATGGY